MGSCNAPGTGEGAEACEWVYNYALLFHISNYMEWSFDGDMKLLERMPVLLKKNNQVETKSLIDFVQPEPLRNLASEARQQQSTLLENTFMQRLNVKL